MSEAAKERRSTPIKLLTGYWVDEDTKLAAGTETTVTKTEAARLIKQGVAERNDPLPG